MSTSQQTVQKSGVLLVVKKKLVVVANLVLILGNSTCEDKLAQSIILERYLWLKGSSLNNKSHFLLSPRDL
jgi:hypothetical protein